MKTRLLPTLTGLFMALSLGVGTPTIVQAGEGFKITCKEQEPNGKGDGTFKCTYRGKSWYQGDKKMAPDHEFVMDMCMSRIIGYGGPPPESGSLVPVDPQWSGWPKCDDDYHARACPGWFFINGKWVYFKVGCPK